MNALVMRKLRIDLLQPLVDMMNAMTSVGLDPKSILDRRAIMNRYIGGHGNLKVLPARPAK